MSERALAFVESWVVENVQPIASEPEGDSSQAKQLAAQCLAAAQAEGIPKAEIDEAIDDLQAFMAGQIKESVDREVAEKDPS
jgi:hypothetical protein